jgi:hypothetical protein
MVRSARLEHLMVRSVAQRRVSNHGPLAPLSPAARPSALALRATADKSGRRCAPPPDESEGVDGRLCCKQQRIYKRFTSMAACSVATRPAPNEKSRPEAAHVVAFICGATARDMSLSCNGPARCAGRNSDRGFSPIPFGRGRQKNECQESCWRGARFHAADRTWDGRDSRTLQKRCRRANAHVLIAIASGVDGRAAPGKYPATSSLAKPLICYKAP